MKITLEANPAPIVAALQKLSKNYGNMAPVMEVIGSALVSSTEQRFEDGKDPSGNPWKPNSETTLLLYAAKHGTKSKKVKDIYVKRGPNKGRFKKGAAIQYATKKVLRDTDVLMNSITRNFGKDWVEVGTPEPYGVTMHYGAKKGSLGTGAYKTRQGTFPIPWGDIPPRPFLGLNQEDEEDIMDILQRFLAVL